MTNIWLTSSNISHFSTNTNKSVAWATTPHEHLDIKQIIDTERSAARISSKVSKVHCRLAVTWRSVGFVSWWLWEHRLCQWWSSSMKMDEAWVVPWGHRQQIWVALPNLAESEWTWSDLAILAIGPLLGKGFSQSGTCLARVAPGRDPNSAKSCRRVGSLQCCRAGIPSELQIVTVNPMPRYAQCGACPADSEPSPCVSFSSDIDMVFGHASFNQVSRSWIESFECY